MNGLLTNVSACIPSQDKSQKQMRLNGLTHLAFWHFARKSPWKQPLSLTSAHMRVAILPWRLQEDRWSRSAQSYAAAREGVATPSLSRASPTSMHSIDRQRSMTDTMPRERIIEGRHRLLRDDGMCRLCTLRLDKFSLFTHSPPFHMKHGAEDCFGELASILHNGAMHQKTPKLSPDSSKGSGAMQGNGESGTALLMSKLSNSASQEEVFDILNGLDARSLLHVALDQVSYCFTFTYALFHTHTSVSPSPSPTPLCLPVSLLPFLPLPLFLAPTSRPPLPPSAPCPPPPHYREFVSRCNCCKRINSRRCSQETGHTTSLSSSRRRWAIKF